MTQASVARDAELSTAYISELENGVASRPSGQVLMQLSKALGVTIADLLGTSPSAPKVSVSATLKSFATERDLPEGDVAMLAGIKFRGEPPRSKERWAMIYDTIRMSEALDE